MNYIHIERFNVTYIKDGHIQESQTSPSKYVEPMCENVGSHSVLCSHDCPETVTGLDLPESGSEGDKRRWATRTKPIAGICASREDTRSLF